MNTNRHERFRGEAALECGGPPQDGFAVANLTPLSGTKLIRFAVASSVWRNICLRGRKRNLQQNFDQYKTESCAIEYRG